MSPSCDPYSHIKKRKKNTIFLIPRNNKPESNFCSLVLPTASSGNDVRRKLYTVGIRLTVEKQAKGMPDTTVETTLRENLKSGLCVRSQLCL